MKLVWPLRVFLGDFEMKIWSNDIVRGHGLLTNGKKYEVCRILHALEGCGRGFYFTDDEGNITFAMELGSSHLKPNGKWIIEEDE